MFRDEEEKRKAVEDYLKSKYQDRFAKLQSDRDGVVSELDAKSTSPDLGKRLMMGLVAAGRNKQTFEDVRDDYQKQQELDRAKALRPFDEQRKNLLDEFNLDKDVSSFERSKVLQEREDEKYKAEQSEREALRDPNSPQTSFARELAAKMLPGKDFSGLTGEQLFKVLPSLEKIYSIDQNRLARQDAAAQRALERELREKDKKDARDDKKKQTLNEIEDRRQNILAAIDSLDEMIGKKGTWEAFGSHNQDLDRLVDQIATDMAKLMDPNSVARPGEVELVKKQLVESGFKNRNSTARDVLKNFKGEVERRANSAYSIRGLEPPGTKEAPKSGKVRVSNGKETYEIDEADLSEAEKDGYKRI